MSRVFRDITGKESLTDLNQVALNLKMIVKIGPVLPPKEIQNQRVETQKEDLEVVLMKRTIVTVMEVGVIVANEEEKDIDVEVGLQVMVLMVIESESASTVKHLKEIWKKPGSRQKRPNETTAPSLSLAFISMLMKKRSISSLQRQESAKLETSALLEINAPVNLKGKYQAYINLLFR